ncbi:MAG: hypothetical protein ABR584_10995 [Candidatus Baltobacteraceae bacterium]
MKTVLLSGVAALVALFGVPAAASAHGHHHQNEYVHYNGALVDNEGDDENDDDVVSVAEPLYYAPVQSDYVVAQTQYVPVNDTIITPYGYRPQDDNGYYQGYGYNPAYTNNPYYAGATYGGDPVASAVVGTLVNAAVSGGHVNSQSVIQSLLTGLIASQMQRAQPQYGYGQPQPYYQPQQYVQQYEPAQVYQQVIQRQLVPVAVPGGFVRGHGHGHGDEGDDGGD